MLLNLWQSPEPSRPLPGAPPSDRVQNDVAPPPHDARLEAKPDVRPEEIPVPEAKSPEDSSPMSPPSHASWKQRVLSGETDDPPAPPPREIKTGVRVHVLDESLAPVKEMSVNTLVVDGASEEDRGALAREAGLRTRGLTIHYPFLKSDNPCLIGFDYRTLDQPFEVEIRVEAPGYLPHTGTRHTVRPGQIDAITIQLTPSPGLRILVRDARTGLPIAGANLLVLDDNVAIGGPIQAKQDEPKLSENRRTASGRTDSGGRIVFRGLP